MTLVIPDEWKSKRQKIIEVYVVHRTVPATVKALGYYKYPSFVRKVVQEYREFLSKSQERLPRKAQQEDKGM